MRLALLCALLVCLAVGAQANMIVFNNGFQGTPPPATYQTLTSGAHLGPWLVGGSGIDWIGGYWPAEDGNGSVDLSALNAGYISTVLPTVAGEEYILKFWLAGNPDGPGDKTVLVTAGNLIEPFTSSGPGLDWTLQTATFTADGNDLLTFNSLAFNAYGPVIDAVTVELVTPEPASMLMAGAGLLAVGGLLRLRRRGRK